jgi:CRISPR system Cascade subunit CasE
MISHEACGGTRIPRSAQSSPTSDDTPAPSSTDRAGDDCHRPVTRGCFSIQGPPVRLEHLTPPIDAEAVCICGRSPVVWDEVYGWLHLDVGSRCPPPGVTSHVPAPANQVHSRRPVPHRTAGPCVDDPIAATGKDAMTTDKDPAPPPYAAHRLAVVDAAATASTQQPHIHPSSGAGEPAPGRRTVSRGRASATWHPNSTTAPPPTVGGPADNAGAPNDRQTEGDFDASAVVDLWRSMIEFGPRGPETDAALQTAQARHDLIMKAFPGTTSRRQAGALHRYIPPQPGRWPAQLLVRSVARPDWSLLTDPTDNARLPTVEVTNVGPFWAQLAVGARYRFRLTASPARAVRDRRAGSTGSRGRSPRIPVTDPTEQIDWLTRVLHDAADLNRVHVSTPTRTAGRRGRRTVVLTSVTFHGDLTVLDPCRLRHHAILGIGPDKMYGNGLLVIAPTNPDPTSTDTMIGHPGNRPSWLTKTTAMDRPIGDHPL